jgi:hypothetical protein
MEMTKNFDGRYFTMPNNQSNPGFRDKPGKQQGISQMVDAAASMICAGGFGDGDGLEGRFWEDLGNGRGELAGGGVR